MNDTHPQQNAKEEIPDTSKFFDENQLDQSFDQQFSKLNFHRRNSTISAAEKSFKDEEYIYVCIFPLYLELETIAIICIIDWIWGRRSSKSD